VPAPITFTLDLEDHRPHPAVAARYPEVTRGILAALGERGITGTFFVVGEIAEAEPDLVREIAAAGHELALHGWRHVVFTEQTPDGLAADVARGKALLEDLGQRDVVGFRAPTFSLVASTVWATDVLFDAGFTYSSSVLPGPSPLYGFPGAPRDPFRWPNGLVELPVPTAGLGRAQLPYLGGTYLRILPEPVILLVHRRGDRSLPWTYMHPYDVDTAEPYWVVPDAGWMSPALWVGRTSLLRKLDRLGAGRGGFGPPLRDRLALAQTTFDPRSLLTAAEAP
jgi:polysaccharide deacetylase family protein (PEP-CTERM system associated)